MPERREWPRPRLEMALEEVASGFGYVQFGRNTGQPGADLPMRGKVVLYRGGVGVVRGVRYAPGNPEGVPANLRSEVERVFSLSGGATVNFSFPRREAEEVEVPQSEEDGDEGNE